MPVLIFAIVLCFLLTSPALAASVPVQEVLSPHGIKAWLVQDDRVPVLTLRVAFRGGVEQDPVDKQGLAEMTAALLTQGAGRFNAEAFQQRLADHSIELQFGAGRDFLSGSLKTLRDDREIAFDAMRLALTSPRFGGKDIERTRAQQRTAMQGEMGSPEWQGRYALLSRLFAGHPYGLRHFGTTETLKNITRQDIQTFAKRHLTKDNLVVAVAGNISASELAPALDRIFGALPKHAQNTPVPEAATPHETPALLVPREGTQTNLLFALPMLRREDPDWYAAEIVNYILGGGGFSSRLMKEVRDNKGLTYGIGTQLAPMEHASLLLGHASTDNPKAGEVFHLVKQVWRDVYDNGVTEDEIAAAKNYLTGSLPLTLTSTQAIAGVLIAMQTQNLGMDYLDRRNALLRNVSAEDVQRVLHQWFNPDHLIFTMVGKPEGVTPTETVPQTVE